MWALPGIPPWRGSDLDYPDQSVAPPPNPDLPHDALADYQEAMGIVGRSPRGAAALLRLALQRLMVHLGKPGKNINEDIASLVADGLPAQIQQALDVVRVIGNSAVHPGEIRFEDDSSVAFGLFDLVNIIAEDRISRPTRVAEMYAKLPKRAVDAIDKRDRKGDTQAETDES